MIGERQKQLIESYSALVEIESEFLKNDYFLQKEVNPLLETGGFDFKDALPSAFFSEHKNEFGMLLQKSGMLLSMNLWRNMGRNLEFKKSREGLARVGKSWQRTFFAFFEDWRFREQLFTYMHSVRLSYFNIESIYSERIESSLFPEVKKQLGIVSELMDRLPDPDTSEMDAIRSFFVSELYRLKKRKLSEVQNNSLLMTTEDIPKLLLKLENEVREKLEIFPEKVGVVGNPNYMNGIKASEISYFSPSEFIGFECLQDFQSKLSQQGNELRNELKMIINEFGEYDQIIDFYLDSAISLSEKAGVKESEVISFFKDGLVRLQKISTKISESLEELQKQKLSEISDMMKEYLKDVSELDDNNNIVNIYTRLLKSRTLAESRSKRNAFLRFSKRTFSGISATLVKHTGWLKLSYSDIRKKLRLNDSSETISSEISNQLTGIQQRIFTLPVIYQHLFENSPLTEVNLFLSREEEINKLNAAFAIWLKGNFAASLVTGENGSGKSSLLHYYSKDLKTIHKIHSFQVSRFYYTEADYYTLIGEIFNKPELQGDEDIDKFISSFKERRIMIIDGLERLFIRKVNGFACLQKLLLLIVSSNQKIFWICSVSKYASAYLNKTIAISEYFDYNIRIDSLSSKQIQDIVLKRNRLSGYRVTYLADKLAGENAKTKKLTQSDLEDKFFAELNLFAGSNISLSLNYWLQSIQSIQEDHLEIGSFEAPDFGFLENISPEKAYTLLVIVMHGKISVDQHALIFNQKTEKSFKVLTILSEDSILVKQNEYYILNSILFRNVVRVLENRNLIH